MLYPSSTQNGVTPPRPQPAEQMILNRYRVLSSNTEGGFGTVNVCWDTRLQRRVAIKTIPLRVSGGPAVPVSTLDEALSEARTSSLLAHPNIVTVYDFETDGNDSYLVMEYVDGLNLADLLARVEGGVLTFDETAHVLRSVAAALAFAHENGVLHLDIKPANIMIDRSGTVKLGDFGMATLASAAGYGGARGGTVGYMPPEQIVGDLVDERTDIFSLAVVVWQCLTGSCPFSAPTADLSLQKLERGPIPALSKVEPALAGMVEETLLTALEPKASQRMVAVEDLAEPVIAYLGDPQEGKESLHDLIDQPAPGDEPEEDGVDAPGLLERAPWLPAVVERGICAVCAAAVCLPALRVVLGADVTPTLVGLAAVAAATCAWPPLGAPLAAVAMALALAVAGGAEALAACLALLLIYGAWWVYAGRKAKLASAALLLPCLLPAPSSGLAGLCLTPLAAGLTGALAWLFRLAFRACQAAAFEPGALVGLLASAAAEPTSWVTLATCGLAALACSALCQRGSVAAGVAGQVLCLLVLACGQLGPTLMENADIWTALATPYMALAILFTVILCIVTVLAGPSSQGQEGDDF